MVRCNGQTAGRRCGLIVSSQADALEDSMDVIDDVIYELRKVHPGFAALKTRALSDTVVSTAVHGAVDLFRVHLGVLVALEAIVEDGALHLGFKVDGIAAPCLILELAEGDVAGTIGADAAVHAGLVACISDLGGCDVICFPRFLPFQNAPLVLLEETLRDWNQLRILRAGVIRRSFAK